MQVILWIPIALKAGAAIGGALLNKSLRQDETAQSIGLQLQANKEMAQVNKQNALDIWNKTGLPEQVKQAKKAGMNPALLYGMGGQGGATTSGGQGGAIGGGNAGSYDIASNMVQLQLMNAQKEKLEAETQKAKAEAEKTAGVDTQEAQTRIADLTQGISNKQAQEILTKAQTTMQGVQNEIAEAGKEVEIQKVFWSGEMAMNALQQAQNETYISNETYKEKVEQITKQTALMALETEAKKAGINLTKEQARNISEQIRIQDAKIDIDAFKATLEAVNPSINNALGGEVQRLINTLNRITGKGAKDYRIYERSDK